MDATLRSTSALQLDRGYNAVALLLATRAGARTNESGEAATVALEVASTLFGQQGTAWKQRFLDDLATSYGAGVEIVDFRTAAEPARQRINGWTQEHTAGLVRDLLPSGAVDSGTRLVLVNALHLKAPWHRAFEPGLTTPRPFHLADGTVVDVPTMTADGVGSAYADEDGWKGVRLPYAGGQLAMSLLLPDPGREQELVARLSTGLPAVLGSFRDSRALVSLPRFDLRWGSESLRSVLQEMGLRVAFTIDADFTAMTTDEALCIDDVFHQATITVDEEGTEAAAATAVVMTDTSAPAQPVGLALDRPFLFVVHDVESGAPLFVGRVSDPR